MFNSDTIKRRVSCRTYKDDPIKEADRQKLREFILTNVQGAFGNKVRFELVDLAGNEADKLTTLATYGMIKGASTFIVGAVTKGDRAGGLRLLHGKDCSDGNTSGTGDMLAGGHLQPQCFGFQDQQTR